MAKNKNETFPCPACGYPASSKSGLTLHMKTCCPDKIRQQTTVKMTIEFTVGMDYSKLQAAQLFQKCWGAWKQRTGAHAKLLSASVEDVQVGTRKKSALEKKKEAQAEVNKERRQASAEVRAVINEALGKDLMERLWKRIVTTAKKWPKKLEWDFWEKMTPSGNAYHPGVKIRFDPVTVSLHIQRRVRGTHKYAVGAYEPTVRVRLADPRCFEQIRKACLEKEWQ